MPRKTEIRSEVATRLARLLGSPVGQARRALGGYTPTERWILALEDGRKAFAKIGVNERVALWLRREEWIYRRVRTSFMPELLAFEDHPVAPILVIEDLSGAHWPPPWSPERVAGVRQALEELHSGGFPCPQFGIAWEGGIAGWQEIQREPTAFLGLGLTSRDWLDRSLPALIAAEAKVDVEGEALCHFDVRSDNLCFSGDRTLLIDWNLASAGNPRFDLGFFLPSLRAEGGPIPESLLPEAPEVAAGVSGFFAARAGLPIIPQAPRVREVQLQQLGPALAWACRELDLEVPEAVARWC